MDQVTSSSTLPDSVASVASTGIHQHKLPSGSGLSSIIVISPPFSSSTGGSSGGNNGEDVSASLLKMLMHPILESIEGISQTMSSMATRHMRDIGQIMFLITLLVSAVLYFAYQFSSRLETINAKVDATNAMLGKIMYRSQRMEAQLHQISEDSLSMRVDLLKNFLNKSDDEEDDDEFKNDEWSEEEEEKLDRKASGPTNLNSQQDELLLRKDSPSSLLSVSAVEENLSIASKSSKIVEEQEDEDGA